MWAFAAGYLMFGSLIAFLAYALGFVRVARKMAGWQAFLSGVLVYAAIVLGYPLIAIGCAIMYWKWTRFD